MRIAIRESECSHRVSSANAVKNKPPKVIKRKKTERADGIKKYIKYFRVKFRNTVFLLRLSERYKKGTVVLKVFN